MVVVVVARLLRIAMEGLGLRRDVVEGRVRGVLLFYDGRVVVVVERVHGVAIDTM